MSGGSHNNGTGTLAAQAELPSLSLAPTHLNTRQLPLGVGGVHPHGTKLGSGRDQGAAWAVTTGLPLPLNGVVGTGIHSDHSVASASATVTGSSPSTRCGRCRIAILTVESGSSNRVATALKQRESILGDRDTPPCTTTGTLAGTHVHDAAQKL